MAANEWRKWRKTSEENGGRGNKMAELRIIADNGKINRRNNGNKGRSSK